MGFARTNFTANNRLESHWRAVFACLALMVGMVLASFQWGVPWLASRAASAVPDGLAYDLGRGTLQLLDQLHFKPSELPEAHKAKLQQDFARLAADYPSLPLTLHFRHAGLPNVFALPDGTVVATDELVHMADNTEEVLAVLAHEIGHVHHRHALRMALESSVMALLLMSYFGDVTQVSSLLSRLPTVYAQAHFSRTHEYEADSFALEYLHKTSIAPHHPPTQEERIQRFK